MPSKYHEWSRGSFVCSGMGHACGAPGRCVCFAAEAWWSDAVTPLAYLAAHTERIQLGTGIMQVTARTPAMTAMTALTLNDLTGGRFILGLGPVGPRSWKGFTACPSIQP